MYNLLDLKNKPFLSLEISHAIRKFSIGLGALFIPLLLLAGGFTLSQVFIYLAVAQFSTAIGYVLFGMISNRVDLKYILIAHFPVYLVSTYYLLEIPSHFGILLLLGASLGFSLSMYWLSHHVQFNAFSIKNKRGLSAGIEKSIATISRSLAPAFGGLILGFANTDILFVVMAVLYLIAIIPLLYIPELRLKCHFTSLFQFSAIDKHASFIWGINGLVLVATTLIFRIFVFLHVTDQLLVIGLLAAASTIVLLFENIITGILFDKGKVTIMKIGVLCSSLVIGSMYFVSSVIHVLVVNILKTFFAGLYSTSLTAEIYEESQKSNETVSYFIKQGVVSNLVQSGLLLCVAIMGGNNIQYIFPVVGLCLFSLLLIPITLKNNN